VDDHIIFFCFPLIPNREDSEENFLPSYIKRQKSVKTKTNIVSLEESEKHQPEIVSTPGSAETARKSDNLQPKKRRSSKLNTFVVKNGTETLTFSLPQLISWMEQNGEFAFFDAIPKHVKVGPKSTEKVNIAFVPLDEGKYSAVFKIFLGPFMVHHFTVRATAEKKAEVSVETKSVVRRTLRQSKVNQEEDKGTKSSVGHARRSTRKSK